jgi:hypothetical protein
MAALPLIVFDVNETLLDPQTLEPTFERIQEPPQRIIPLRQAVDETVSSS